MRVARVRYQDAPVDVRTAALLLFDHLRKRTLACRWITGSTLPLLCDNRETSLGPCFRKAIALSRGALCHSAERSGGCVDRHKSTHRHSRSAEPQHQSDNFAGRRARTEGWRGPAVRCAPRRLVEGKRWLRCSVVDKLARRLLHPPCTSMQPSGAKMIHRYPVRSRTPHHAHAHADGRDRKEEEDAARMHKAVR